MRSLICLGDSITAGETFENGDPRLTPRLRAALPGWRVTNAGIGGNNTADALARLQRDVLAPAPDLVIVYLGANDAAYIKRVQLPAYTANMREIARQIGPARTILVTPAPIDEDWSRYRTNKVMTQYARAVQEVADEMGCACVDLYSAMRAVAGYPKMLSDGLHFAPSGYAFLAPLLADAVNAWEADS